MLTIKISEYTTRGGISPSLTTMQGGGQEPKILDVGIRETEDGFHLYRNDKKKSSIQGTHVTYPIGKTHALTTNHKPMTTNGFKIRKLTPRECFRLQGFPDWAFDRAAEVNSDSQLYKQAGNSVTVNVIYEIARKL